MPRRVRKVYREGRDRNRFFIGKYRFFGFKIGNHIIVEENHNIIII